MLTTSQATRYPYFLTLWVDPSRILYIRHAKNIFDKTNDPLRYLVLQDNQGRFCLGYGQFPSSSLVIEGHLKIHS